MGVAQDATQGSMPVQDSTPAYAFTLRRTLCSKPAEIESEMITQVGISEVVYAQGYNLDSTAAAIFKEGGVHLRQFSPPREGLIDLGPKMDLPLDLLKLNGS
ncbi:hypothetical protein LTS18_006498 [Coniosporium uncinatum]|uniref:Uncharacterized protein n=1 Tax=Coniosporium uncinatum TaxID=93489 RepID=A0ACC3DQM9_9PEZI|nr:hypothetical protein LTS18_006498 [Coniosporium uncinatum]